MQESEIILESLRKISLPKKVPVSWPTSFTVESDAAGDCRRYLGERLFMSFEAFAKSVGAPNA